MPRIPPLRHFSAEVQKAHQWHIAEHHGRITNMKATMSRSLKVFEAYMHWYPLFEEVKKITGERAAVLYAHAISSASDCILCTTYFRKITLDAGYPVEKIALQEDEQLLCDFGRAIARHKGFVSDDLYHKIAAKYTPDEIVILAGFAGIMIATNIFNNLLQVEIDEYLFNYLPKKTDYDFER